MSTDDMKTLARRSLGMWAATAEDNADEVFLPSYQNHQEPLAAGGVSTITLAEWKAVVRANHEAFPDLYVDFIGQQADGDRVSTHWRFTATHTGPYAGLAATGRKVSWTGVQIDRFADGKIAESWVVWDKFTLFSTLGLIASVDAT